MSRVEDAREALHAALAELEQAVRDEERSRTHGGGRAVTVNCNDCQQDVTIPYTDFYASCGCPGAQWSLKIQVYKDW
jgi:hypothetical protein